MQAQPGGALPTSGCTTKRECGRWWSTCIPWGTGELPHTIAGLADGFIGGRDAARELLRSGFDPTAIVCVNDITAVGLLRELRDRGIAVPGQISVGGFDNISLAEFSSPSLTTIHTPRDRIGQ